MRAASLLAATCLAFVAPSAFATQVIFEEDFESGMDGWIADDPWHIEADTDPCGSLIAPFPVGQNAAHYGTANCDYVDYGTASELRMANSIHIPAGKLATLTFTGYEDAECLSCFWDFRYIIVYANTPIPQHTHDSAGSRRTRHDRRRHHARCNTSRR